MSIESTAQLLDEVRADVARQLGHALVPAATEGFAAGFSLNDELHGSVEAFRGPIPDVAGAPRPVAVVGWRWSSQHAGSLFGEAPTQRFVVAKGVTFIRRDDEFVIRYIDWLSIAVQLGLSLNGRSSQPGGSVSGIATGDGSSPSGGRTGTPQRGRTKAGSAGARSKAPAPTTPTPKRSSKGKQSKP